MAKEQVSTAEAKEVAKKFMHIVSVNEKFKEWKEAKLSNPIVCYGIDDNPTAYLFELKKSGSYLGYIVISATKDNYPVLEFSKGKSPLMRALELGIKPEKVYYLGGIIYIFKQNGRYYYLFGNIINFKMIKQGIKEFLKDEKVKKHLAKRSVEAKSQWNSFKGKLLTTSAIIEKKIYGVPLLKWYRGCAPTSAAMVLGYWDQHGYSNFTDDYQTKLIDDLADAMGTWSLWPFIEGATWPWMIDDGINAVCKKYGYFR